tara:strand:- start:875 stop:1510 length:636 start_codon:yes stop_codon:yes gene_type:complete
MRYQAALRPECCTNTAVKTKFKGYNSYKFIINLILSAIRDHMIIECPNCNKKFNLEEKLIPKNGRNLKCNGCDHIWHYKVALKADTEDFKISEYQKTSSDIESSDIDNKKIFGEKRNDDGALNTDKNILKVEKNEIRKINVENKNKKEKELSFKMIFIYFIVIIISLIGIIILLDTFKTYLSNIFPNLSTFFNTFSETLLDLKLFIKDLIN